VTMPAQLFTRPSHSIAPICVYFRASGAGVNNNLNSYPAFWTSDQREAELFIEIGSKPETLGLLDGLYQKGQFALLDHTFQVIEDATLKKRTQEQIDTAAKSHSSNIDGSDTSTG
jgi:hypothetical protein